MESLVSASTKTTTMKTPLIHSMRWIPLLGIVVTSTVRANNSFNAELSHFVGNLALASVSTVVIDKFAPEVKKPALVGFAISATEAFLGECLDKVQGGQLSMLDVAVGTVGAAVGAFATDQWYIQPRMNTDRQETSGSVMLIRRF